MAVVTGIAVLSLIFPFIAVSLRRLHDQGKSGWWYWISVIPVIGAIWFIDLMVMEGTPGPNQCGNAAAE